MGQTRQESDHLTLIGITMSEFDWEKVIEEASVDGAFELMISETPEKDTAAAIATADGLNAIVTMMYEKDYDNLPGWLVLEALSAICIAMYKATGTDIEI